MESGARLDEVGVVVVVKKKKMLLELWLLMLLLVVMKLLEVELIVVKRRWSWCGEGVGSDGDDGMVVVVEM